MNKNISHWQFAGFGFTSLAGTVLHFLYDICGKSLLLAPVSAVNESTWEHMKLLFFPLFIFAIIERIFLKEIRLYWAVKLKGTFLGLSLIPIIFYTYNGMFGKSPDWINISIFFVAAATTFIYEPKHLKHDDHSIISNRIALMVFGLISAAFILFTFFTPEIPLFMDPITGTYGIKN